jgi:hypothetical protein
VAFEKLTAVQFVKKSLPSGLRELKANYRVHKSPLSVSYVKINYGN